MSHEDSRTDAWEGRPKPIAAAVMMLVLSLTLPFAILIGVVDWLNARLRAKDA